MKELKITLLNYWLIKIGLKTLELRAYEKIGNGGEFKLTTTWGRILAIINLHHESSYNHDWHEFGFIIDSPRPNYFSFQFQKHYVYIAKRWFWRRWVKHYLDKGQTPAFYEIIAFESLTTCR